MAERDPYLGNHNGSSEESFNVTVGDNSMMSSVVTSLDQLDYEDSMTMQEDITHNAPGSPSRRAQAEMLERLTNENRQMRLELKQLHADYQTEQDTVAKLRSKMTAADKDRFKAVSESNEEVGNLQGELTRLRAQLEKGEATRHELDYELTKVRRELNNERRQMSDKEGVMTDVNEHMKQQISSLTSQLTELTNELQTFKSLSDSEKRHLAGSVADKDQVIARFQTETEILRNEKDQLEVMMQTKEITLEEQDSKIQELEEEQKKSLEKLRQHLNELEFAKEKEERLRKELDIIQNKLKTTEESIEAERAAHLESKFNSEIVQLRVRDLEEGIQSEKVTKSDLTDQIERLNSQMQDLERAYQEERKMNKHGRDTLDKLEKEYENTRAKLSAEIDDKVKVINAMSEQLDIHQENFDKLKQELNKAKKCQVYLEETYGGSMRELEFLLQNFNVDSKQKKKKKDGDTATPVTPSVVLENLRRTLTGYKKRLEGAGEEIKNVKTSSSHLGKEIESYKDMIWAKDKALQETQESLGKTSKEVSRLRNECTELEANLAAQKVQLQTSQQECDKERHRCQELNEEIMKLAKRYKTDEEGRLSFLHKIYQKLLNRQTQPPSIGGYDTFKWMDLSNLVNEQVISFLGLLQRTEEKVTHLEAIISSKEETIDQLQIAHEDQMDKLAVMTREREEERKREKQELEEHYGKLVGEIQSRSKKTQAMADQAWEKVRMTGSVQHGLEQECVQMREQLRQYQSHTSSLLSACAILSGALHVSNTKIHSLSSQRKILQNLVNNYERFKSKVCNLINTIQVEMDSDGREPNREQRPRKAGLLRFRVAAIAVIAANRLNYLKSFSHKFLPGSGGSIAVTHSVMRKAQKFKGIGRSSMYDTPRDPVSIHDNEIHMWLQDQKLLEGIVSSMDETQHVLLQKQHGDNNLTYTVKTSYSKLLGILESCYKGHDTPQIDLYDMTTPIAYLGQGLMRKLPNVPVERKLTLLSSQQALTTLQHYIIDFTQRLHNAETQRRGMKSELKSLKQNINSLNHEQQKLKSMEQDVENLRNMNAQMIDLSKFEGVCTELDNALKREQQAQQLLNEQSQQLQEFTVRLEMYNSEGAQKQQSLTATEHDLTEARSELRRKEQTLRQLNKTVAQLETDKDILDEKVYDAETALRTVAKDKDVLAGYVKNVEMALSKSKQEMALSNTLDIGALAPLLNTELAPPGGNSGKWAAELAACQSLVATFIDTYQQALSRVTSLEQQLDSHKRHIETLKDELSAACRREYQEDDLVYSQRSRPTRDRYDQKDSFHPLMEDTEASSYSLLRPASPRSRSLASRSPPLKENRSPLFHTPARSIRTMSTRSRPYTGMSPR